jgi:hypothetical protein
VARRSCAAFVVLLMSVMPLVGGAHVSAERHHFCAEHRVFEEGAFDAAPDAASAVDRAPDATRAAAHEACPFAPHAPPAHHGLSVHVVVRSVAVACAPHTPILSAGSPPIALLTLAPKSSPPLLALS